MRKFAKRRRGKNYCN